MPTTYAIPNGRTVMDATLYTGTGTSGRLITNNDIGTNGFLPDLTWIKCRSFAYNHNVYDSNRGAPLFLSPNLTAAQSSGDLIAFNSNGFTINQTAGYELNANGQTYVAWQWNAGSNTTSSNTQGSITSTVSVNQTAGFSIVTYTGNGTNGATVGHGLGASPGMIIVKRRDTTSFWMVAHSSLSSGNNLILNLTNAQSAATGFTDGGIGSFNSTTFTCTQGVSSSANINANGGTYVAYCWAPIAGYSAFGSYTGNGSYGGPFVYTGFRPKFVMLKMTSSTNPWQMYDSSRDPYNYSYHILAANSSSAEDSSSGAGVAIDLLSNGFKIRTDWADINTNGGSYIYMAWAENPLKFANAR